MQCEYPHDQLASQSDVLQDMGAADCTYFGLTVEDDTCTPSVSQLNLVLTMALLRSLTQDLNNMGSLLFGRLSAELVKSSQPLGTVGLTPNWDLRSQIARYISMGRVNEPTEDAAGTVGVSAIVLLVGIHAMIGSFS